MRKFVFILAQLVFIAGFANAEKRISITGDIAACRLEKALSSIDEHYQKGEREFVLDLDSVGGDLGAAIEFIERLDRFHGATFNTQVTGSWSQCSSACFPIFAAGEKRKALSGTEFFVHGLSWHRSESLSLLPEEDEFLVDIPWQNEERLVSLLFGNFFTTKSSCTLGYNRYWLAGDQPNLALAMEEYLAAVRRSSQKIAEEITPYIKGSAKRKKTYEPKDLRKIDPEFLMSN